MFLSKIENFNVARGLVFLYYIFQSALGVDMFSDKKNARLAGLMA